MATPNAQLRRERQLRGWSQAYLAEQIEVPDYYMSRWERGEVSPSPFYQQKLCELLDKTAEELGFLQSATSEVVVSVTPTTLSKHPTPVIPVMQARGEVKDNPFTYGNPISEPERFFGRTLEVEQIFMRLRNAEFESSSIVGERRIGKTSLLKYLAHPLVHQHNGLDSSTYLFVYVDLQVVDENTTPTRLWQWLLRQIANSCDDLRVKQILSEVQQSQLIDNFALEDAFDNLDEMGKYVVLLLDEFEHVTGNTNFNAAYFYGLRSLAIHHHLALITSSRSELVELCHSEAIRSSPFFNIFATINLGSFTYDEAQTLISRSLASTAISFTPVEIDTLLHLAGLHPYFLQAACSSLFDGYIRRCNPDERIAFLRKAFREEARPHLAFYWQSSGNHEKVALIALMIVAIQGRSDGANAHPYHLQDLYPYSSQPLVQLERRGMIIVTGNNAFALFSQAFCEWIWDEITETQKNKQGYDEWLATHKQASQQLNSMPAAQRKELISLLARVNEQYRDLFLYWLGEPGVFNTAGRWIKEHVEGKRGGSE